MHKRFHNRLNYLTELSSRANSFRPQLLLEMLPVLKHLYP